MTQCLNPHENLSNYEFSENEAKIYRPKYDTVTGHFLNLYENMGYYWFAVTVANVFWTMDIQKRILKYSTVSIKKDAE